jgi:hypothetical protein
MVDDDMFIDALDLDSPEIALLQNDRRILCLSCRMSPRMDVFFMKNRPQQVPRFGPGRTWKWKGLKGDWGYPMSAGGMHIFRTPDLVDAVVGCEYSSPNTFEDHALLERPPARPLMVCFEEAKVFCAAVNKVQTLNENRHSNSFPLAVLNETFLSGKRLSPHTHHQWRSRSPHGEARYEWLPEEVGVGDGGRGSSSGGSVGQG